MIDENEIPPKFSHIEYYKSLIMSNYILFILIGIPIWWITTAVYRAPLPFDTISKNHILNSKVLHLPITFYVSSDVESFTHNLEKCIDTQLMTVYEHLNGYSSGIHVFYRPIVINASEKKGPGVYSIKVETGNKNEIEVAGRSLTIKHDKSSRDVDIPVCHLIVSMLAQESADMKQFTDTLKQDHDEETMKTLKYDNTFRISFSILNGNSEKVPVRAELSSVIRHVEPFFTRLCHFSNFKLNLQIREFCRLTIDPVVASDNASFQVLPTMFPELVNTASWGLSSAISNETEINLMAYVPSQAIHPLYIMSDEDTQSVNNALTLPRSGGFVILNEVINGRISEEQLIKLVPVWLQQLRELLQIKPILGSETHFETYFHKNYGYKVKIMSDLSGITDMELDSLIRKRTAETIFNTIDTLEALDRMLNKMTNMAVGDHIKARVIEALKYLQVASTDNQGDIQRMFNAARNANEAAESAFFDHTMTSLLYFPNEHLLAVYLPFLFPVAVPYFSSVIKYFKAASDNVKL